MATVRARRSSRRPRYEAPASRAMPRMAMMKLEGAQRVADSFKAMGQPENLRAMMLSGVIMAGAAVACAAWIGGSLVSTREMVANAIDDAGEKAGFALKDKIEVRGVGDARAAEVRAVAMSEGRASLFSATPAALKKRVEALPWVEHARVRRMWPSRIEIDVQRREAYALRRDAGAVAVLNANGAPVANVPAANLGPYAGLPVLVGKPAGASAHDMLLALENMPSIRTRMDSLVRVGGRRWNLKMKSGTYVALPQTGETAALATLAALQDKYALLDRPLARIDLREPGQVAVLPRDTLVGGPGLAGDERAMAGYAPGA